MNVTKSLTYKFQKSRCDVCCAYWIDYCLGLGDIYSDSTSTQVSRSKGDSSNQIKKPCGSAEAYSFGCKCVLCMTIGREEYLKVVAA